MEALDILESFMEAIEVLEAVHNLLPAAVFILLCLLVTQSCCLSRKKQRLVHIVYTV